MVGWLFWEYVAFDLTSVVGASKWKSGANSVKLWVQVSDCKWWVCQVQGAPMGAPRGKLGWRHFAQRAVRAVLVIIFAEGLYFFFGVFEVYKLLLV